MVLLSHSPPHPKPRATRVHIFAECWILRFPPWWRWWRWCTPLLSCSFLCLCYPISMQMYCISAPMATSTTPFDIIYRSAIVGWRDYFCFRLKIFAPSTIATSQKFEALQQELHVRGDGSFVSYLRLHSNMYAPVPKRGRLLTYIPPLPRLPVRAMGGM